VSKKHRLILQAIIQGSCAEQCKMDRQLMMNYKGYLGRIAYDDGAKLFYGEIVGLKDVITFQGTSVKELTKAFKDSVDDYLTWCKERGEKPEKMF